MQRSLCLSYSTEDWLFEGPACTSKVHGALSAGENEMAGDEPRKFADPENAMRRAVTMDNGSLCKT